MTDEGKIYAAAREAVNARENIAVAEVLLESSPPRFAVTRVYYAVFHAMRAMLYSIGLEPTTHSGTHHLFHLHFIKPGTFAREIGKLGSDLQKAREAADYAPDFEIDTATVVEHLASARAFVEQVARSVTPRSEPE